MNLSPETRQVMNDFIRQTAAAYRSEVGQEYAATPAIAQSLNLKIIEDGNWFLRLINGGVPVKEVSGEKVGMGLTGSVTSRTDTSGSGERVAKSLHDLNGKLYQLYKTDSDAAMKYSEIDVWAQFPEFHKLYAQALRQAIANDRLKIGWNGTSVAADTVAADLSDVNIGWLKQIRDYNGGAQYVLGAGGSVTLGGGTFPNLDTLVFDAANRIEEPYQDDPNLVVLVGRSVIQAAKGSFFEAQGDTPSEKEKIKDKKVYDTYGGLTAYYPPFFDADSILITPLKNLSIYYQNSSWRRQQIDNPKKDQYEDFNTRNEGYVVEEEGMTSLVEGIEYA